MAKKETLVCRPCEVFVLVTDQGDAVIECYECGAEMVRKTTKKPPARKAVKAAPPRKAVAKKSAAKKAAPKNKK
jgi:uncharacterized Zn finger protein